MNNELNEINKKNYKTLTPFKGWVIENFPFIEADFDAITNYQLICKVTEYLNTVIYNQNQVEDLSDDLVDGYNNLLNYVNDYFDNLNLQEEVNTKLDEMASDGTLTNLIKNYVDPIYQAYEEQINQAISNQNGQIEQIENQVNSVASGSPLVATSTSDMTDTTRIYVNTTDGKWYYYDGDSWEIGGTYQASGIADNSVNYYKLSQDLQSNFVANYTSIGEITEGYYLPDTSNYRLDVASGNRVRIADVTGINKIFVTTKILSTSLYAVTFFNSSNVRVAKYDIGATTITQKEFDVPSTATKVVVNNASTLVPVDIQIANYEIENIDFDKLNDDVVKSLSIKDLGPLTKGYVVFMSDDGASSAVTNTFPIIESKNIPWTFACWTGSDIIDNASYFSQLQTLMSNYNVKICQHWWQSYTNLSKSQLLTHLRNQKTAWETLQIDVNGLCYPSHDHDDYIMAVCGSLFNVCAGGGNFSNPLQGTKVIYPNRNNGPRTNMYELYRVSVDSQTLDQLKDKIDYAYNNHLLLIIYVHDVDVTGDVKTRLESAIDYAKNLGVELTTINDLDKII